VTSLTVLALLFLIASVNPPGSGELLEGGSSQSSKTEEYDAYTAYSYTLAPLRSDTSLELCRVPTTRKWKGFSSPPGRAVSSGKLRRYVGIQGWSFSSLFRAPDLQSSFI